ncbi:MAG: MarR family transcriptional regulator [Candidatus Omnitrophica bacterium]|nr:MarR family transcriptional regulator [Candidatus Omnitrophota bacterium]
MSQISLSEFADRVGKIMPVIMKDFMKHQAAVFYKMDVTMPQFFVMEHISRCGDCRMGELAKFINVTTAAMTGLIDRVVRDGYVSRFSDPKDRRIVKVKLTPKGAKVVGEAMKHRREAAIRMFSMISQEDREQYLKILTRIKDKMQEQG